MPNGKVKEGNVRLQLSISIEADKLLRNHAPKRCDKSNIVNNLIIEKFGASK